jgi:CHAT domain-containing protein/tetratricopeptide (TPR) repeat protein
MSAGKTNLETWETPVKSLACIATSSLSVFAVLLAWPALTNLQCSPQGRGLSLSRPELSAREYPRGVESPRTQPQAASRTRILQLKPAQPIEREIGPGETHSYRLILQAGEFVHLFIFQKGVNVSGVLIDPAGSKVIEVDTPLSAQEPEWITYLAPTSGSYRVDIRAVEQDAPPGRYEITIEEKRRVAPADQIRLSAEKLSVEAGNLYHESNTDSYRKAIEKYERAIDLYRGAKRDLEEAVSLNCAARTHTLVSDYPRAAELFQSALSIYRSKANAGGEGATLNGLGFAEYLKGSYDQAIKHFEEALKARQSVGYRAGEARTLVNIGLSHQAAKRFAEARPSFERALVIQRELKLKADEANTIDSLAFTYWMADDYKKAIELYEQALDLNRELNNRAAEEKTLDRLGFAYRKTNDPQAAIRCYEQAIAISRELKDKKSEADALDGLGFTYWIGDNFRKAVETDQLLVPIYRELKDHAGEVRSLKRLAYAYRKTDQSEKAARCYEELLAMYREAGDRSAEADALDDLGFTYYLISDYEKALTYYERCLAIHRQLEDRAHEATALDWIARVNSGLKKYENAADYYDQELGIRRDLKDRSGEATVLQSLGSTLSHLKRPEKATEYFQDALSIQREVKDQVGEGHTLDSMAGAYSESGEHEKAFASYRQAQTIWRELRYQSSEASTIWSMAFMYEGLHDQQNAIKYYEEALAIRRELKDRSGEVLALLALGRVHFWTEDKKSGAYFDEALAIQRDIGDRSGEAKTLVLLGAIQAKAGHYDKELSCYEQALAVSRQAGDPQGAGLASIAVGSTYLRLQLFAKAIDYFEQAVAILSDMKNRSSQGKALSAAGIAYEVSRQHEKALDYFEKALVIARETKDRAEEAQVLSFESLAYTNFNKDAESLSCLEQALAIAREIGDRLTEDTTLFAQAIRYIRLKQLDKATDSLERALAISRETKVREIEAGTLGLLMAVWAERGKPRLAIVFGKQSIGILQGIRNEMPDLDQVLRQSFLEGKKSTYRYLADLLAGQGRLAEAQQALDLLKENEFSRFVLRDRELSAEQQRMPLTPQETQWEQRYREVADRLTALGVRRGSLLAKVNRTAADDKELSAIEADLETGNRAFENFLNQVETAMGSGKSASAQITRVREAEGLMETLRDLGPGTVAIYTIVGEQSYRSILITPDVQKGYSYSISGAELNKVILAFRQVVRNPASDPRPLAKRLYEIIFKPMEKDLEGAQAKTIMWALDGALRYMPMAALYDGERFLVERFSNVVFTPASQSRLKDPVSHDWHGLGFGVSLPHDGFQPLPNVPSELSSIIQTGSKDQHGILPGTVRLDGAFTKEEFRAELRKHYSVVHVASHFDFAPGTDRNSFLLLGDGGKLTLDEFRSMPQVLQGVELLTLSACDTAVGGEDADGKEVEGFAVLAQRQGAKAVLATLWAVADQSTALLMKEFYRLRTSDPTMTKAEALRQAQLELLTGRIRGDVSANRGPRVESSDTPKFAQDPQKPFAHPYFWAPFLLMGNWK